MNEDQNNWLSWTPDYAIDNINKYIYIGYSQILAIQYNNSDYTAILY